MNANFKRIGARSVAVAALAALALLGGCNGDRDRQLSEQIMAARMAAEKADKARIGAEKALEKLKNDQQAANYQTTPAREVEPEEPDDGAVDVDTETGFVDNEPQPVDGAA